jgi:ribose transport system permease protein
VVQQGGFDLSLAGSVSLAVVVSTHYPQGDNALLLAGILIAIACAILAGLANGILVSVFRLNAIVATIGVNALLYGAVFAVSGDVPKTTTTLLAAIAGGQTFWLPNAVYFALAALLVVSFILKKSVAGRRFEAIGANPLATRAAGLRVQLHQLLTSMPSSSIAWPACSSPASRVNPQHSKAIRCSCLRSPSSFSAERRCLVVAVFRSRPSSPRSS